MKKWFGLAVLGLYVLAGCSSSGGDLPTAPPVAGTPAGPSAKESTEKGTKRQAAGAISQSDLTN